MRRYRLALVVAALVIATIGTRWVQGASDGLPPSDEFPPTEDHPIPGWTYLAKYRLSDGQIVAIIGFDPERPATLHEREGEALLDMTDSPLLSQFLDDARAGKLDLWRVDLEKLQLIREAEVPPRSPLLASVSSLWSLVALFGTVAAGGFVLVLRLRRRG